jgi:hypothetical protein
VRSAIVRLGISSVAVVERSLIIASSRPGQGTSPRCTTGIIQPGFVQATALRKSRVFTRRGQSCWRFSGFLEPRRDSPMGDDELTLESSLGAAAGARPDRMDVPLSEDGAPNLPALHSLARDHCPVTGRTAAAFLVRPARPHVFPLALVSDLPRAPVAERSVCPKSLPVQQHPFCKISAPFGRGRHPSLFRRARQFRLADREHRGECG